MSKSTKTTYRLLAVDDEAAVLKGYASVLTPAVAGSGSALMNMESELFDSSAGSRTSPLSTALDCVSSGDAAVEAVREARQKEKPYSVIFIDVRMPPGINGVEAAAQIRGIDPDAEIVFVTGYADFRAEMEALKIVPLEKLFYVKKPFGGDQLWDLTAALCHKWSGMEPAGSKEVELLKAANFAERSLNTMNLSMLRFALNGVADDGRVDDFPSVRSHTS